MKQAMQRWADACSRKISTVNLQTRFAGDASPSPQRLCDFSTLSESHVCDKSQDDFVEIRRHFTGTAGVYSSDSEQQKKFVSRVSIILFTTKHSTETINLQLQGLQGCQNSERHWGCKVRLEQKCRPSLCVWSELGIASHAKSVTAHWVLL